MSSGFDLWEITSNRLSNYKQKDHCHIRNMSLGKLVLLCSKLYIISGDTFATYLNRKLSSTGNENMYNYLR